MVMSGAMFAEFHRMYVRANPTDVMGYPAVMRAFKTALAAQMRRPDALTAVCCASLRGTNQVV
jgi:hypothetical protein